MESLSLVSITVADRWSSSPSGSVEDLSQILSLVPVEMLDCIFVLVSVSDTAAGGSCYSFFF